MNPSPDNLTDDARRKGGHALHAPESLALRLVRKWPDLDTDRRAVVLDLLRPLVTPEPGAGGDRA
jgi:hypothetical protein